MGEPTKDKPKKKGRPVEGWPGETKKAFRDRLLREEKWSAYVKVRAQIIKGQQCTTAEAHRQLWQAYPPPGAKKLFSDPLGTRLDAAVAEGGAGLYEFKTKRTGISEKEVARWVFDNIARKDVEYDDAPSAGAWALLMWVRVPGHKTQFYQNIWGKILAQKTDEGASAERFRDTGQSQLELIEQIESALLSPGPEGAEGEPSVPAEDDRVGVEQQGEGAVAVDDV